MCGLVGMFGNITVSQEKMFSDMLIFDTIRGKDSTGAVLIPMKPTAAAVKNDDYYNPIVEKELGFPDNLWTWGNSKIFNEKGFPRRTCRILMGHNRAATFGKVNQENAHPFEFGDIIGAHNGSLRDWKDLYRASEFDVDTKALYAHIEHHGVEHAWKTFIGAAALTWFDKGNDTFNIIRNTERPLFLLKSEDETTCFYASEEWMVEMAAKNRKVALKKEKDEKGNDILWVRRFEEDYHYQYEVSNVGWTLVARNKLEKKPLPPKVTQKATQTGGYNTASNVGFRGNRKFKISSTVDKTKKVSSAQLNKFWAKDMVKADKDTRGCEFSILSCLENGLRFTARLENWPTKHILTIYSDSWEEAEEIKANFLSGSRKYVTTSRLRMKEKETFNLYGISSRGITPLIKNVNRGTQEKKEEPKVLPIVEQANKLRDAWGLETETDDVDLGPEYDLDRQFLSAMEEDDDWLNPTPNQVRKSTDHVYNAYLYNGMWVTADTWREMAAKCTNGSTCVYCGDPLDIDDHQDIVYLDDHNCMCPSCVSIPAALSSMESLFPSIRSKTSMLA